MGTIIQVDQSGLIWDALPEATHHCSPTDSLLNLQQSMNNFFDTAWRRIKFITLTVGVVGGGLAIANLPIPAIREPIAKHAPILLLPSIIAWDHNYREGTVALEQAEQLIQQAKHPDDLTGGDRYLKSAKEHLNALPSDGINNYEASSYCYFRTCSWRFSGGEIQQRRESLARVEATLTQEQNLQSQLQQTIDAIAESQVNYKNAKGDIQKQSIVTQWEQDIEQLAALSSSTLTGRLANVEREKAQTAFKNATGFSHDQKRSGNLIQAAKQFAISAQKMTLGESHSVSEWQAILNQWDSAIGPLKSISVDNPDYVSSRKTLADYQQQQSRARIRLQEEQTAIALLQTTEAQINVLVRTHTNLNRDQAKAEMMAIEANLKKIAPGTTTHPQAQEWLNSLRKRLNS
jgi:hypothetical protein